MSGDEIIVRSMSWPAGDGTYLDLDLARDAGGRLEGAGKEVAALRSGKGASIESAGEAKPWGTDDVGKELDKNYQQIAPTILKLWQQVGTVMTAMGTGVKQAATTTSETDQASSKRVDRAANHKPDIPL